MPPDDRDELFSPSVQALPVAGGEPPYRSGSLIYPAFFGGPLAMLPFARRSAKRLGLRDQDVARITWICLAALAAGTAFVVVLDANGVTGRGQRLTLQVAGLLAYLAVAKLLRGPERQRDMRSGQFVKLSFWLGLAACLVLGLVQGLLLLAVLGIVR